MFLTFTVNLSQDGKGKEYDRVAFNTDHILSVGPSNNPLPADLSVLKLTNGQTYFVAGHFETLLEKINSALK